MGLYESEIAEMIPVRHASTLKILGPLPGTMDLSLEGETPLFAADRNFAWEHGGPLTRAFVETLPADVSRPVIIDSSLVWLTPGLAHGFELGPSSRLMRPRAPLRFLHEPFPGVATGVRGASNRNLAAVNRLCIFGLSCTPMVAVGEFAFSDANEAEAFWLPSESLDVREIEVERRLAEGLLAHVPIPVGVMVDFGWGTLMRARSATVSGFQFILRATIADPRPVVNARRNLSII